MYKIGFDNDKYLSMQSEKIKERIAKFGGKLYLEFGGKLFDDYHASRVLPGFQPDSKLQMLLQLKDQAEVVIVINAEKVEVTGKKRKEKIYKRHTGYPGGLRETTFEKLQAAKPEEIIRHAVKGMLPDGKLGRQMLKKLKVYAGPEHNHAAQKPETWNF